jgi:hypothetical protein
MVSLTKKIAVLFFLNYTVQRRRSQHARTLTSMNTRTQTLPYQHLQRTEHRQIWRFSKSPMAPRRRRDVAYHLMHNASKSWKIQKKVRAPGFEPWRVAL